jgi:hypothetical protein
MSIAKYSPCIIVKSEYIYNAYGKPPVEWTLDMKNSGQTYDVKTMFADYDIDGYDRYGYSAFSNTGEYVGIGKGVDRNGMTEDDYENEHNSFNEDF